MHKENEPRARLARFLPVVVGKICEHHTGKALDSAANLPKFGTDLRRGLAGNVITCLETLINCQYCFN